MRFVFLSLLLVQSLFSKGQHTIASLGLKPPVSKCTPVKDQYLSSTCWSFASNSFLESELIKNGMGRYDLSEMFVARYSMIRKIKTHLQLKGQNYFTPGGQFHDVLWVIKNYGMVPEYVYNGRAHGEKNHDHSMLDTLLKHYTEKMVKDGKTQLAGKDLQYINRLLDEYLGKVPATFEYNGKKYTAVTYARNVLKLDPADYIEITSYTHHPFNTSFVLEDKYNWTSDAYYNVSLNDFMDITDSALAKGYTVEWDGDVDDPEFDFSNGLASLPAPLEDKVSERQLAFENGSTDIDHMMHITGSTNDTYGKKWYYVKNSWGTGNAAAGYLYMSEDYFILKTSAVIVNKKAIPAFIRNKMGL